jgi:hypothetical protein
VTELLATNLVLTLILAELALRAYCAVAGTSLVVCDTLDAHRLVPGQDYGGGLLGNHLGYPGRDFQKATRPGVLRIAALGDSFAVGPAVAFADNYLTQLESRLAGVEVCNFGVSGAGPREYLAVLRKDVWQFQPDLVLVSVFVGNDVTETLPTPRNLDPRQFSLYLLLTRSWRLAQEQGRQGESPGGSATGRLPARGMSPQTFAEVEARRLAVCQKRPARGIDRKWRRALADLDAMVNDCRRQGVRLAVVLIPDEFQANSAVLHLALREANMSRGDLDIEFPQKRLKEFFAQRGVPCLDLLPAFRDQPGTYAPRDTHWNEKGNRLAAVEIARWLRQTVIR